MIEERGFGTFPDANASRAGMQGNAPLIVSSIGSHSLRQYCHDNATLIVSALAECGAVVLRGFAHRGAADFRSASAYLCSTLIESYGDLPISHTPGVFRATPYRADLDIHFHNEASHTNTTPARQFFFCERPAEIGGAWRVADGRAVPSRLPSIILKRVMEHGLIYSRTFIPRVDVGFLEFFGATSLDDAERTAHSLRYAVSWEGGVPTISRRAPGVIIQQGHYVWFNQLLLHHPAALPQQTRTALLKVYGGRLPRSVSFGDGSTISDDTVVSLMECFESVAVDIHTELGDMLIVDNLRCAHARRPFSGPRSVLVALGDPVEIESLPTCELST